MARKIAAFRKERKPIDQLLPHPRNPRVHPESGSAEWKSLARSLEKDYFDPITWNRRNQMLVSGHFRVKVLKSQGVTEVDVVVVDYSEETHLARMIAANRRFGSDDETLQETLLKELGNLKDFDFALTGLDDSAFADLGGDLGGGALFEASTPFAEFSAPEAPSPATERSPAVSPTVPTVAEMKATETATALATAPIPETMVLKPFTALFSPTDHAEFQELMEALRPLAKEVNDESMGENSGSDASVILFALRSAESLM